MLSYIQNHLKPSLVTLLALLLLTSCVNEAARVTLADGQDPHSDSYQGDYSVLKLVNVSVALDPVSTYVRVGDKATVIPFAIDRNENKIPDLDFSITVEPEGAFQLEPAQSGEAQQITFTKPGKITVTATTQLHNKEWSGTREIYVTSGPPDLELNNPFEKKLVTLTDLQAVMSEATDLDQNPRIMLSGSTSVSEGRSELLINDEVVKLNDDGTFQAEVPVVPGINFIRAEAINLDGDSQKDRTVRVLTFVYADAIETVDDKGAINTQGAFLVRIGNNFLDNREVFPQVDDNGHVYTSDVSDLLNVVLASIDLQKSLPGLMDNDYGRLEAKSLQFINPEVSMSLKDSNNSEFSIKIDQVRSDLVGKLKFVSSEIPITGTLEFSVVLTARFAIDLTDLENEGAGIYFVEKPEHDEKSKKSKYVDVAVSKVRFHTTDKELQKDYEKVQGLVKQYLQNQIEIALGTNVVDKLPGYLSNVMKGVYSGLRKREAIVTDLVRINFESTIDGANASVSSVSGIDIPFNTKVYTLNTSKTDNAIGYPRIYPSKPIKSSFVDPPVQVGLSMNYINSGLYVAWKDSGFNLSFQKGKNDFPIERPNFDQLESIDFSLGLPPIIREKEEAGRVKSVVELGDGKVTVKFGGVERTFYVFLRNDVHLALKPTVENNDYDYMVEFVVAPVPDFYLYQEPGEESDMPITYEDLRLFLLERLHKELTRLLGSTISVNIPRPPFDFLLGLAGNSEMLALHEYAYLGHSDSSVMNGNIWLALNLVTGFKVSDKAIFKKVSQQQ